MSRAYRISISESIRRVVRESDGLSTALDLLPILEPERMRELLATELERQGFVREGSVARRTDADGVEVEVDLDAGTVHVRIAGEQEIEVAATRDAWVANPTDERQVEAEREKVRGALEGRIDRAADTMRAGLAAELEKKLGDLRAELDRVVVRTTQEALKERAAQLGEVREVREDPATGSLTIRVKL